MDSSVAQASLRIARIEAILTVSSAVDHKPKHACRTDKWDQIKKRQQMTNLEILLDGSATAGNIWDHLRAFCDCSLQQFGIREL